MLPIWMGPILILVLAFELQRIYRKEKTITQKILRLLKRGAAITFKTAHGIITFGVIIVIIEIVVLNALSTNPEESNNWTGEINFYGDETFYIDNKPLIEDGMVTFYSKNGDKITIAADKCTIVDKTKFKRIGDKYEFTNSPGN